jgi:hypothetical protein
LAVRIGGTGRLSCWLEQLDWVPIGIVDLDLFPARTRLHVVPKMEAGLLQGLDEFLKIVERDADEGAAPSSAG